MKTLTASDRESLIKLASSLPQGDETRKAILAGLRISAFNPTVGMLSDIASELNKLGHREAAQLTRYTDHYRKALDYRNELEKNLSENKKDLSTYLAIIQAILDKSESSVEGGPLKDKIHKAYEISIQLREAVFKM